VLCRSTSAYLRASSQTPRAPSSATPAAWSPRRSASASCTHSSSASTGCPPPRRPAASATAPATGALSAFGFFQRSWKSQSGAHGPLPPSSMQQRQRSERHAYCQHTIKWQRTQQRGLVCHHRFRVVSLCVIYSPSASCHRSKVAMLISTLLLHCSLCVTARPRLPQGHRQRQDVQQHGGRPQPGTRPPARRLAGSRRRQGGTRRPPRTRH